MRIWQATTYSDIDQMDDIARAAERLGYYGITIGDHWVVAGEQLENYLYSADGAVPWRGETHWPDPWVLFTSLARITTSLQFLSSVYVMPLRDVFTVAKAVGTAATLSGGRMHLGVGCGWQRFEFDLVKQTFERRGRHLDEQLVVLPKLWSGRMVEHSGEFYRFDALQMSPPPPSVPIYIGGDSPAALRRAARYDGWIGAAYSFDEIPPLLDKLRMERRVIGRDMNDFAVILACNDLTLERLQMLSELGVTDLVKLCWMEAGKASRAGIAEKIADMEEFAAAMITERKCY